ncbi:MAG: hypothetical protein QOF84_1138 [Streptomyces sp.]|jgi:hypothetical protein|nr:hypothetical protein [Streptomyces sp.]MDX6346348.1 hypothetical protein [Streptomyces sp.]
MMSGLSLGDSPVVLPGEKRPESFERPSRSL